MRKNLNSKFQNWLALLALISVLLFRHHIDQTLSGFILGGSSLYLFLQIQKYGFRNSLWTANRGDIGRVFEYIKDGNLEEVKRIQLKMPVDQFLSLQQYRGNSMLIVAATYGHQDLIEYLMNLGANVNEAADNGETPLIRACYFNRLNIIESLIKHGANMEHRSNQDASALCIAIFREKPLVVDLLLKLGAKLNLDSKMLGLKDKITFMKPEMKEVIDQYVRWQRVKSFLKFHKHREQSKHYPKEFLNLKKNYFIKIVTEYI